MPLITIGFNQEINVSVQVGDLAWYVPTNTQGVQGNQYQTCLLYTSPSPRD